jgi:peptidase E
VSHPKVCFVPTASGDAEGYIQRFYAAFETLPWLAVTAPFIVAVK